ncbi:CcmD family protein [Foetidibacter luteolus]|uniref:CcmD family protein n=1 Tax=Foetidibacter luteolus TaxID=2608880 RepID=UPI001A9866BC|nr:CcmD family protein [Foetidibacter luteolus]
MRNYKYFFLSLVMSMLYVLTYAQSPTESTDFMRSNGKIYVVVAVVVTIVAGIFIYLVSLDKKIKKLEQEDKKK